MSFILDALKKSESERHRHSGPVLMDVRIAPPRRRLPVWAWIIAGVLLVNLLVLVWILLRSPRHAPAINANSTTAPTAPAAAPSAPAPAAVAPPAAALPSPSLSADAGSPAPQGAAPPAQTLPAPAIPAQSPLAPQPAVPPAVSPANNAVIDPRSLPAVPDLIAAGTALPELRLSLHVYDPLPANRYVLLNGTRLGEGEFTRDGVKVVQITPAGAVLEWQGRLMFLSASG